jgi:hypothetical protein
VYIINLRDWRRAYVGEKVVRENEYLSAIVLTQVTELSNYLRNRDKGFEEVSGYSVVGQAIILNVRSEAIGSSRLTNFVVGRQNRASAEMDSTALSLHEDRCYHPKMKFKATSRVTFYTL